MDTDQLQILLTAFQAGIAAVANNAPANNPKISVRIPTFRGAPKDNVMTWML